MSIEALHDQLYPENKKVRLRFVTKIFRALKYTREHPEHINIVGAAWCANGEHFVANSSILGAFLNLKPNSINTNFRDHGFQIIGRGEAGRDMPADTADPTHWKKRHNKEANFSVNATEQELNAINSIQDRINDAEPGAPAQFSFIPKSTVEMLQRDGKQQLSLASTAFSLQGDASREWFYAVLDAATALWKGRIGAQSERVPSQALVQAMFRDLPLEEQERRQLSLNFEWLVQQRDESSQFQDLIQFDTFVKFFLRYGSISDMLSVVMDVSYFESTRNVFQIPGLNEFDSQNADAKVQFKSWFFPSSDRGTAVRWLDRQPGECWVVIPSKTPNYFTLLYKEEGKSHVEALHIIHNCLSPEPGQRFAVMFNNGNFAYEPSLTAMLTNTLGLTIREYEEPTREKPPKDVSADDFVTRKQRAQEIPVEPSSELSQRRFFLQSDSQFSFSQHDTQSYYGLDSQIFP